MRETGRGMSAGAWRLTRGALLVAGVLAAAACGGDGGSDPIPVASVVVTPEAERLFIGETRQATVVTLDAAGNPLANRRVTWISSAPNVAEVSGSGLITAKQAGATQITAVSEGQQDILGVTVIAPVASVNIEPSTLTLDINQEQTFTVTLLDAAGLPLTGRTVSWVSNNGAVASVSETGGRLRANSAGSALIIATSEGKSDTATVTVTSTVFSNCGTVAPLTLAVGEVHRLEGAERSAICLSRDASTEVGPEFALVSFNGSTAGQLQMSLEARGLVAAASPPSPSRAPNASLLVGTGPRRASGAVAFERDLRLRAGRLVAPMAPAARKTITRRRSAGGGAASLSIASGRPSFEVTLGQLMTFNANANGNGCTAARSERTGRVVAISTQAIVVADTANPANGFTDGEYLSFASSFGFPVYAVNTSNFGEPPDIDANNATIIFFTRAVNELTPAGADFVIGGFFFGRDIFPRAPDAAQEYPGCEGSNEAEMFYMLVPDPTGVVNGNVRTKEDVQRRTVSVLAHEFQHLINFGRRVYVNDAFEAEETWLDEGLSHIAEELVFYQAAQATGLGPRQNISIEMLQETQARLDAVNAYQVSNLGRVSLYLKDPELNSPFAPNDELETRGAAWQFLRYLADRRGGDDRDLWRALVNSRIAGLPNLQAVLGGDPLLVMRDWALANYLDDTGLTGDPLFSHPSWHYRSLLAALSTNVGYPLRVRQLTTTSSAVTLTAGGSAYLRFGVAPGGDGYLAVSSQTAPLPPQIDLVLVRTR